MFLHNLSLSYPMPLDENPSRNKTLEAIQVTTIKYAFLFNYQV